MKILLTFTGFHDPFSDGTTAGEKETGPVLTVTAERSFDRVYLFSTPNTAEIASSTKTELEKRHGGIRVEICDVPLKDPTNYLGILKQLRSHFRAISKGTPEAEYFICVSSGTPHMHASWLMLAASGEIPARILQTRASKFATPGAGRVSEIDFTNPQFPQIRPFLDLPNEARGQVFPALCAELGIVGDSENFLSELEKAFKLAEYDSPILLIGETGTGKEVFARLIHRASKRRAKPMVTMNCAAFSESLLESQLFGHRKGAFTGADRDRPGCFEEAHGGTLFLDELGEMPVTCQAKLLRAVQYGVIQRLGDGKESRVDVRVVAATNVEVKRAIEEKRLRQDLYYRFEAKVSLPSLRNRRNDIPKLAHHFLERWNQKHLVQRRFSQSAILALMKHPWPGNVRELEAVVHRSAQLCSEKVIDEKQILFDEAFNNLGAMALPDPYPGFALNGFLTEIRGRLIESAMTKAERNRSKAAKLLGITPQAVSQYLRGRD